MGLPYGENFIILTSTVFLWYTRLTDRQTGDALYSNGIYAVARNNQATDYQLITKLDFYNNNYTDNVQELVYHPERSIR